MGRHGAANAAEDSGRLEPRWRVPSRRHSPSRGYSASGEPPNPAELPSKSPPPAAPLTSKTALPSCRGNLARPKRSAKRDHKRYRETVTPRDSDGKKLRRGTRSRGVGGCRRGGCGLGKAREPRWRKERGPYPAVEQRRGVESPRWAKERDVGVTCLWADSK
ncbi:uncharacterized protein PHA67_014647 [Liasis olivaceus]